MISSNTKRKRKEQIIDADIRYKYRKKLDEKENSYHTIGFIHS